MYNTSVLEVSSRQFRDKQKLYFEMVDTGKRVIVKRPGKSYMIIPVENDDLTISHNMQAKLEKAIQEMKDGKGKEYSLDELRTKMGL
jgi:hypothetical protein